MGSLVKCSGCGERCGTRPIGVYWRWLRSDNVWKKYYARICAGCYASRLLPLDVSYDGTTRLTCPSCGIDTEDDYDGIYTTSFPGHGQQLDTESPFCNVHAAEYRIWVLDHAREIVSVDGALEPRQHDVTAEQAIRDMGRVDPGVR